MPNHWRHVLARRRVAAPRARGEVMAQLTDDCFAFSGPLLRIDDMERLIAERIVPLAEREDVPLRAARGRVLASDIVSPVNVPPFDNSAVDGYAVRNDDLDPTGETPLTVIDRVAWPATAQRARSAAGETTRIFTGAPVPEGADTIFMQEDVRVEGNGVVVPPGLKRGANFDSPARTSKPERSILPAGRRLAAQHVALAAAVGLTTLPVRRRVRVALFSTGDEIVEPGKRAAARGALRFQSLSAVEFARGTWRGCHRSRHPARRAGASVTRDCRGGAQPRSGADLRRRVDRRGRSRPRRGRETRPAGVLARRDQAGPSGGDGRVAGSGGKHSAAFVGLPGNPVAAFVTFVRVVRPLLLRLGGALPEPLDVAPARATFRYRKKKDRREYVRVFAKRNADGMLEVTKYPREGAGLLSSLTETDGFAELARGYHERSSRAIRSAILPYASVIG